MKRLKLFVLIINRKTDTNKLNTEIIDMNMCSLIFNKRFEFIVVKAVVISLLLFAVINLLLIPIYILINYQIGGFLKIYTIMCSIYYIILLCVLSSLYIYNITFKICNIISFVYFILTHNVPKISHKCVNIRNPNIYEQFLYISREINININTSTEYLFMPALLIIFVDIHLSNKQYY